jgi:hypothetical protein
VCGTLHKGENDGDGDDDDNKCNQGTNKKNSHTWHCTYTAESTNVKVQNILNMQNNITCSTNCKYRTAATLYTLEIWFV